MIRRAAVAVLLSTAAFTTACSTDTTSTPAALSTTPAPPAAPAVRALGDPITITRTDTGATVGTIRFLEVREIPNRCTLTDPPHTSIGVRVEIQSGPGEELPPPDVYSLRYNDAGGAAREVETAINYRCEGDYPEAVSAPPGGRSEGWVVVEVASAPSELVYAPYVADRSSTVQDLRYLTVSPDVVRVAVGDLGVVADPAPADEATMVVPAPTTAAVPRTTAVPAVPVAPPTGRDSQGRANGSGGALVGCADENYQPGTGIYADGSKGFAAECLPGGSMR